MLDCYAHGPDGRRLYDTAFLSRAKGRAKSELAGLIVCAEAFGPVRFAGWAEGGEEFRWRDFRYQFEPGEPMGRPVTYPFIRILATEEGQVGHTYDNVYYNLTHGPLAEDLPRDAAGLTRVFLPQGGEIRPSTASSASKDGGKETHSVFDEPHLYILDELRRMYRMVDRNMRKRKQASPWAHLTSTMYQPGQDSVAESIHEHAKLIAEGKSRSTRLLYDHLEAPPDVDLTSADAIIAALREVYGPFADEESVDLRGIVESEFWNIEKPIEETRRFFFNQRTAAVDSYTTAQDWDACAVEGQIAFDDTIAMFFDGSKSGDATGLVACRMSDGFVQQLAAWEAPAGPDGEGWQVDRVEVDATVRAMVDLYDVVGFFADVKEFESYVDAWGQDFADKLLVDGTVGRYRHPVAFDMRARIPEFTAAAERMLVDITSRDLTHDGNRQLRRHMLNARRAPNRYGISISKESRESPHKIDLAVCAIGARMVRRLVLASKAWAERDSKLGGAVW